MQLILSIILGIILYKIFFGNTILSKKDLMDSLSEKDRLTLLNALPPKLIDEDKTLFLKIPRGTKSFYDACGLFMSLIGPFNIYLHNASGTQYIDGLFMPNINNYVLSGGHIFYASINHRGDMEWSDDYGKYVRLNKAGHYFMYIPTRCRHCGKPINYRNDGLNFNGYKSSEAAAHPHSIHRYCEECREKLTDTSMFYTFFIDKWDNKLVTINDKEKFRQYLVELFQVKEVYEAIEEHNPNEIEAEVCNAGINMTLSDYTCNLGEGMAEQCYRCIACI